MKLIIKLIVTLLCLETLPLQAFYANRPTCDMLKPYKCAPNDDLDSAIICCLQNHPDDVEQCVLCTFEGLITPEELKVEIDRVKSLLEQVKKNPKILENVKKLPAKKK